MWVPTFNWGPRCGGSLLLIGDPGVGPYFLMGPNSWDGSHCKVMLKELLNFRNIKSLE